MIVNKHKIALDFFQNLYIKISKKILNLKQTHQILQPLPIKTQ
jgi:hypothetical protein